MSFTDFLYFVLVFLIILAAFAVFWLVAGYVLFRLVDRKLRRCPNCKRGAAGVIIETEAEPLGVQLDRSGKQAVRIRSEKVVDQFECKHCGHHWMRSFKRTERIPMDGKTIP